MWKKWDGVVDTTLLDIRGLISENIGKITSIAFSQFCNFDFILNFTFVMKKLGHIM